jgi:hypothetical protein
MPTKIDDATKKALAAYKGPVTVCPPGDADAKPVPMSAAAKWLAEHRHDARTVDPKAENKRQRKAAYERDRIRKRNAAIMKGRGT